MSHIEMSCCPFITTIARAALDMTSLPIGRLAFFLLYLADISLQQSSAHWDELNATVQGRLVRGIPLARPCFKLANGTGGDFNPDECSIVIQDYLNEGALFIRSLDGEFVRLSYVF